MRSKIGTKSRLAALMLALVLLILMLVYLAPANGVSEKDRTSRTPPAALRKGPTPSRAGKAMTASEDSHPDARRRAGAAPTNTTADLAPLARHAPPGKSDTLDKTHTPAVATRFPTAQLRPPGTDGAEPVAPAPAPGIAAITPFHSETLDKGTETVPIGEPLRPPAVPAADPAPAETDEAIAGETASAGEQPESDPFTEPETVGIEPPATGGLSLSEPEPREEIEAVPAAEENPDPASPNDSTSDSDMAADAPPAAQPDESGSLVIAASEAAVAVAAATPLPNANLEVLGDGVFWLDSSHDLASELAAIPEIGTLVLLTPLPGFRATGFEHVKTEAIPADAADLGHDSAEHFLHVTEDMKRPIVVAPLVGTRGAAFFKGVYLLANRNLSTEDVLREVDHELEQAGEAREEIEHRLLRFADSLREE